MLLLKTLLYVQNLKYFQVNMQMVVMENEKNKNCLVESDRLRDSLRRDIKSLEMSNNDLSDQLFFLTNENITMKEEYDSMRWGFVWENQERESSFC